MKQFTVIGKKSVYRVAGKSVQHVTRQLRAARITWQAIHEDKEEV